ncbi:hypothetical protein V2J09_013513, partial [Rumex salicifolius]
SNYSKADSVQVNRVESPHTEQCWKSYYGQGCDLLPPYLRDVVPPSSGVLLQQSGSDHSWGSNTGQPRPHLVRWGEVIKPKAMGGLGLRGMKELNVALNGKLAWRFMNNKNSVWADLWTALAPPGCWDEFFGLPFASWIRWNLMMTGRGGDDESWQETFPSACWQMWKWRNEAVFSKVPFGGDRDEVVVRQVRDYRLVWARLEGGAERRRTEIAVSWTPPPSGWVRLNTDGAVREGRATAAGVLRDESGSWLVGFVHNLGSCSVPMAELWGILSGLRLAWERGYRRVCLNTDSQLAVLLLNKPVDQCHPLSSLLISVASFLRRDWEIQFRHIFREGNRVADALATLAFDFPVGITCFVSPPISVFFFVSEDSRGVCFPRKVPV